MPGSRPRVRRRLAWGILGAASAGSGRRSSSCSGRTRIRHPQRFSTTPAQEPERAVKAPLSPEAKRVAMRFIQTAVARENLDEAWHLVGPNLRGGLTKARWTTGANPVVPYPDRQARGRAVQGRRVVRHERAPRDRAPPARGIGCPRPDLLPRAAKARDGSEGPLGGRQLGAARLGGRPPMSAQREQPRGHQGGGERPGRGVPARAASGCPADALDDELHESTVEARGYWAGVWLRLRRDKLALAGAVFIVLLFLVAFAGAPLAAKLLGHGPNEPFLVSGGLDADQLPAGPMDDGREAAGGRLGRRAALHPRLRLDARRATSSCASSTARRSRSRSGSARRCSPSSSGRSSGRSPGFYRGWVDTADLPDARAHDGVPVPALRDHARGDARDTAQRGDARLPRARGC